METMYLDLWTDVVCPFCYLGLRQLSRAIADSAHPEAVVVRHHAFELDSRAPADYGQPLNEMLAKKYDMPVERAESLHRRLTAEAAELDMAWRLDQARPGNTFSAHRLIAWANTQGLGGAMAERLFAAYFCEGRAIGDEPTLLELAAQVGLDSPHEALTREEVAEAVREDERAATELGVSGVPALVVDGRFLVVGAQGVEGFAGALERAWRRRDVAPV